MAEAHTGYSIAEFRVIILLGKHKSIAFNHRLENVTVDCEQIETIYRRVYTDLQGFRVANSA